MKTLSLDEIFVPGGIPSYTYVPREEIALEEKLRDALRQHKLITVTGSTKSGKTVLVRKIFPSDESIWINGGHIKSEEDFWNFILASIDGYTAKGKEKAKTKECGGYSDVSSQGILPFIGAFKAKLGVNKKSGKTSQMHTSLNLPPKIAAFTQIQKFKTPIIIDDFHYIEKDLQGDILRSIKPLILEGHNIIIIAIPHRRYDSIKLEREFVGRLECIDIPSWSEEELETIPQIGFALLNVTISDTSQDRMAKEALGSPHLMQDFCRSFAKANNVSKTEKKPKGLPLISESLFIDKAEEFGMVIYEKLSKGPTERSKRLKRPLVTGGTADTYQLTLLALAYIKPGMGTIPYPQLVDTARNLLMDKRPETNEITRVLEKISEIAYSDDSSVPILDFEKDERKIHITDPFFAFFLKWGQLDEFHG